MGKEIKGPSNGNMAMRPLRLLIVEDSQNDVDLVIHELKRGGYDVKWKRVQSAVDMESSLDTESWDIVISDFKMPDFTGLDALHLLQKMNIDIPFIISSGTIGEETAVSIMKAGASDYIMKDNLSRLSSAVERELRDAEVRKGRKKANEDLKVSNEWLKLAQSAAKSGFWNWDMDTGKLSWSEEFYKLFELPMNAEPSFDTWKKVLHPEDIQSATDSISRSIEDRKPLENEYRIILPDGQIKWIGSIGSPMYDESGKPKRMSGICMDITARKNTENLAQENELRYHILFENMLEGFSYCKMIYKDGKPRDFIYLSVNGRFESLTGLHDVIGRKVTDVIPGIRESNPELFDIYGRVASTGNPEKFEIYVGILKIWFSVSVYSPQKDHFVAVFDNITVRKKSEEDLKKSSDEIYDLYNNAPYGYHSLDKDGYFIQINDTELKWLGYSREELIGSKKFTYVIAQEDIGVFNKTFPVLKTRGYINNIEGNLIRKDGSILPVIINATAVKDEKGNFLYSRSSVFDNTERKRAEMLLKDSEFFLQESQRIALIGSYRTDFVSGFWESSRILDNIFGIDKKYSRSIQGWLEILHPDDRTMMDKYLRENVLTKGKSFKKEYRIVRRSDGETRWVIGLGELEFDSKGKVISMIGTIQDITEHKNAEEMLVEKEKILSESQRIAHVGSWNWKIGADKVVWSDETYRIYGVARDNFIPTTETLLDLIHPDERQKMQEWIRSCAEGKKPPELEFRAIMPDGNIKFISSRGDLQYDSDSRPLCMMGTVQDITERKKAEELLKATYAFNESLVQTIPFGIEIVDHEGHILFLSPEMEKMLGKKPIGEYCWDIYKDDRKQCVGCPLKQQIKIGETRKIETVGALGGKTFEITHTGMIYQGKKAILEIFIDITDRKKLEDRLRQSEKMEAIGQLAGGIAHDFNNQLMGIMGYAEMLAVRLDDKNLREYAENIMRASKRSSDLTKDLLAFSRKGKIRSVSVNMHNEIEEVVSILERSIDKRIEIKRILKASPATVMGDPSQLQNALLNIAINARDAMPEGGELVFTTENLRFQGSPLNDEFLREEFGHCMKISISDTGRGMDKETIKHIFEPFFTTKEVGKGTGMGLASVYGTVNNHHGIINVRSELGKGSVFTLYFPVTEEKDEKDISEKKNAVLSRKLTIMLVEDEELVRGMVVKMLNSLGNKVIACKDGIEAVELYKKAYKDIDMVVLDMIMPKMSGKDTFSALKEINPEVKVLLSSGYSIDGEAQEILNAGANGFIQKPFKSNEIANAIGDIIGKV